MAEVLRLFVSATHDLEAERAVIGRAIADLPVQIGIEIRRTPESGWPLESIHEAIANVDRVYFLMGRDITAPAGAEWHLAWSLERDVLPMRRFGGVTPAAQEFLRRAPIPWLRVRSQTHLARLVTLDIVRILNHPANRYGLSVTELELLGVHAARVQQQMAALVEEPDGAQGGGVLLDMGHREPLLGVALDER
jgi:hypothetical protein